VCSSDLVDIDMDGDEDLFIGCYADGSRGKISYFNNTGTPISPSYTFVTDDFIGISILSFVNIKPQFADIDKNGGLDLVFTATNPQNNRTSLYYVPSKSKTSPSFGGQPLEMLNLSLETDENVTMTDIDLDGNLDALVGTSSGSLEYWRNTGVGNTFSLANSKFLGLSDSPYRQNIATAVGDIDADGREDIIVGDQLGQLSVFGDFRSRGTNPQPVTSLVYDSFSKSYTSKNLGGKLRPAVIRLMGNDTPEIIVGNTQGGLFVLKNDNGNPLADQPFVTIFPNPVQFGQAISIKSDRNVRMEIYTTDRKSVV
jgi:hypothetical protein